MTGAAWLAWALPAVPFAGGAGLTITGARLNRQAPATGIAIAAATLGLACAAAVARPAVSAPLLDGIAAGFRVDGLSAVLVITVASMLLAVLAVAVADREPAQSHSRFYGLMLLFAGAMLVTVTSTTLPPLLMGWEAMGAASYALIAFWWKQPRRVAAANVAFLTTRTADLGLYLAAGAAMAGGAGSLALARLPDTTRPWLDLVTAGVVAAALGKSAQLPFSFWLSAAMQGPSPVSALLHSATMVAAGAYLLLRLQPLLAASAWAGPCTAWAGVITALALGLVAVAQTDLKQLLAASTCAQVGFMVLAAGTGGVRGGAWLLVAHAATKGLLFLAAGAWLTALGTRQLPSLRGAARRYPLIGIPFTAGAGVLAGLPPGSLWVTKDEVLAAALHAGPALYATGVAASVMSAVYCAKAVWYVWQPAPAEAGTGQVPGLAGVPLAVLAVLAAGLGILAVLPGLDGVFGTVGEPSPAWWELVVTAGGALLAAAVTWGIAGRFRSFSRRLYLERAGRGSPGGGWLVGWLYLERAAYLLVAGPVLRLARALARFDDRVLDRAVTGVGRGGLRLASVAALADDDGVDGAVSHLAAGARRLGRLARWPQTGQVYAYYAQAAVLLVVLALVFVLVR